MAEESATPPNPNPGDGNQPAARPEYIPEKFWDAATGQPRTEDLAKSFSHLEKKLGEGKAAYDAERLKARPEKPEGYAVKLDPAKLPQGLVILDKAPGDDFKPEAGKSYIVLKDDDMMKFWRQHCFDNGIGQDAFQAGLVQFAKMMGAATPTPEQIKASRDETYKALGEHGEQRVQHLWGRLQNTLGERAAALDDLVDSPEAIEALELLLEKAGEPKFSPGQGAADATGAATAKAEIAKLQGDPEFQKKFLDRSHPEHKDAFEKMRKLHEQAARAA